jgi:hypothetical protein
VLSGKLFSRCASAGYSTVVVLGQVNRQVREDEVDVEDLLRYVSDIVASLSRLLIAYPPSGAPLGGSDVGLLPTLGVLYEETLDLIMEELKAGEALR